MQLLLVQALKKIKAIEEGISVAELIEKILKEYLKK